jgi:uracil-DNA glycosylase
MTEKLIIVGEAPGGELDLADREWMSLTGGAARNLCRIADWEWENFLAGTVRFNLFYAPVNHWDFDQAARNARLLAPQLKGRQTLILGEKVANAFELIGKTFYEWFWAYDGLVARVPHPSGRNRKWNRPDERERARKFLEGLI